MLKIYAENLKGETRIFDSIETLMIQKEEGVAADLLVVKLTGSVFEELLSLKVEENGEEIFSGIVDEQNVEISNRELTELVCRSFGAVLIDNEARPQNFVNPDMRLIFEQYLKPYGIESFNGENKVFKGEFKVRKGMSCYKVLEEFCLPVYGLYPRIEGKTLILEPSRKKLKFSGDKGITCENLSYSILRMRPISLVRVKTQEEGSYGTFIRNESAIDRKICRERYFNGTLSSGRSLREAYEAIKLSNSEDEAFSVDVSLRLTDVLGCEAEISAWNFPAEKKLYVSSLRYWISKNKESTKLVLKKENTYVDNEIYV